METKMEAFNMEPRELTIDELDETSGGFLWIAAVVAGFAAGTAIRMGIDYARERLF
jgi:hypothetical protein